MRSKKTKVLPYELPTTVCSIPFSRHSAYQMFSIFTWDQINRCKLKRRRKKTAHSKTVSFSFELNGLHHFHRPEVIISYRCKYAQKTWFFSAQNKPNTKVVVVCCIRNLWDTNYTNCFQSNALFAIYVCVHCAFLYLSPSLPQCMRLNSNCLLWMYLLVVVCVFFATYECIPHHQ